jgi:hypothetical protein
MRQAFSFMLPSEYGKSSSYGPLAYDEFLIARSFRQARLRAFVSRLAAWRKRARQSGGESFIELGGDGTYLVPLESIIGSHDAGGGVFRSIRPILPRSAYACWREAFIGEELPRCPIGLVRGPQGLYVEANAQSLVSLELSRFRGERELRARIGNRPA